MSENSIKNIFQNGNWYHTFEYQNIITKGTFDYREIIKTLGIPSLKNLDVLDVGCSDGFFSKYFIEKLNASSVTGVDINKYDGDIAFEVLKSYEKNFKDKYEEHNDFLSLRDDYHALGLKDSNKFNFVKKVFDIKGMKFENGSIYDLFPFGQYDFVFCGSLFEHLRDPITAFEQLLFATKNFCIVDISNTFRSYRIGSKPYLEYTNSGGNFFKYSDNSVIQIMKNVGFKDVKVLSSYKIKIEKYGYKIPHTVFVGYK